MLRTLPRQNDLLIELRYFIDRGKLMPVLQFARRELLDTGSVIDPAKRGKGNMPHE